MSPFKKMTIVVVLLTLTAVSYAFAADLTNPAERQTREQILAQIYRVSSDQLDGRSGDSGASVGESNAAAPND